MQGEIVCGARRKQPGQVMLAHYRLKTLSTKISPPSGITGIEYVPGVSVGDLYWRLRCFRISELACTVTRRFSAFTAVGWV